MYSKVTKLFCNSLKIITFYTDAHHSLPSYNYNYHIRSTADIAFDDTFNSKMFDIVHITNDNVSKELMSSVLLNRMVLRNFQKLFSKCFKANGNRFGYIIYCHRSSKCRVNLSK